MVHGEKTMNTLVIVVAVLAMAYLLIAMIAPEWF